MVYRETISGGRESLEKIHRRKSNGENQAKELNRRTKLKNQTEV